MVSITLTESIDMKWLDCDFGGSSNNRFNKIRKKIRRATAEIAVIAEKDQPFVTLGILEGALTDRINYKTSKNKSFSYRQQNVLVISMIIVTCG